MDPTRGRRWMTLDRLIADCYVHELEMSGPVWQQFASSEDFLTVLRARVSWFGGDIELVDRAAGDPHGGAVAVSTRPPAWSPR